MKHLILATLACFMLTVLVGGSTGCEQKDAMDQQKTQRRPPVPPDKVRPAPGPGSGVEAGDGGE